jgi:sarcosine oxidase subunit gamma
VSDAVSDGVPDLMLAARPALDAPLRVGSWTVTEEDAPLAWLAVPLGGEEALAAALSSAGLGWPAPGRSVVGAMGTLMRIGGDHAICHGASAKALAEAMGPAAWLTDVSDGWVSLRLAGADPRPALEYACPLDLSDAAFPDGACTRSMVAHIGTVLAREAADAWRLLTPRSTARSFAHRLEEALTLAG